jgi:putative hydrolase of the HAD superfamily
LVKIYTDIFFDLDRTLWDFDRNSNETVHELFVNLKIEEQVGVQFQPFFQKFIEMNDSLWKDYRQGEISKDDLRTSRFSQTFFHFKSGDWKTAHKMSALYLEMCPYKSHLVEGAKEVLDYLIDHYKIHLITNGFSESQRIKIRSSGLESYFTEIIIADETPYRKPMRAIFKHAMEKAGSLPKNSIMIGDDLHKDILGAKKASMDQVFFNYMDKPAVKPRPTFEIKKLTELLEVL